MLVDEIYANKGHYMKRLSMHSRGRHGIRHKHFSHLTVRVRQVEPEELAANGKHMEWNKRRRKANMAAAAAAKAGEVVAESTPKRRWKSPWKLQEAAAAAAAAETSG